MRVPSYVHFKRQTDSLTSQYEKIDILQEKINSGKKLINSSDDPVLAQRIKSTKDYIEYLDSLKNNMIMANTRASLVESSVKGSINEMARVAELIKSAQNDTLNDVDRQNIAHELEGIIKNIANYANSRDSNGDYIFSGTSTSIMPFSIVNSHYEYLGSQEVASIKVGGSSMVPYGDSGQKLLGDIMQGNGIFTISQGAIKNTGTAETSVGYITHQASYVEDNYTLTFVTNSAGKLAYQVTGAISGQVIPVPPQTTPSDAPEYKAGDTITFNGINFVITGNPNLSDEFKIAPSAKQNALETISQLVDLLKQPIVNDSDKAAYHQKLGELSESVQGVSKHLTQYLSVVGYRSKELETIQTANISNRNQQELILSDYESADQYELISELTQRMSSLELTQKTYAKLQSFLMNY